MTRGFLASRSDSQSLAERIISSRLAERYSIPDWIGLASIRFLADDSDRILDRIMD